MRTQVLSVVCDNASNNNMMMDQLELEIGGQLGIQTHIRCFAHILNLVVKVSTALFPFLLQHSLVLY